MEVHLPIALAAGFISFLSPCVLPLIPGYISYISGLSLNELGNRKQLVLLKTIYFCLGFSLVFITFGATASFIGKLLINYSNELRIIDGVVIIFFSMQLLGIVNIGILNREKRYYTKNHINNLIFPIFVGAAFGFGWTPCIGPFLGSILALAAIEETFYKSLLLLTFYSLGLAIPFVISGYAISKLLSFSKKITKYTNVITKSGGIILLTTGILILGNKLQAIGFYILKILPFLQNFG